MNQNRARDPLYAGPRQPDRTPGETLSNGSPRSNVGAGTRPSEGVNSRAQKFEDEKRRIIESCFAKRDNDGAQVES